MRSDTRYGFRFAAGAASTVALGVLIVDALSDPAEQQFHGPPIVWEVSIPSGGAFIWSYLVAAGIASALNGIEKVPSVHAYAGGVAFALLTPLVAHFLYAAPFSIAAVTLLIWLVAFPGLVTVAFWRQFRRLDDKCATSDLA
jgi:hypothetical protein